MGTGERGSGAEYGSTVGQWTMRIGLKMKIVEDEEWSGGYWVRGRIFFKSWVITWISDLKRIVLTAGIEEGEIVTRLRVMIKGELGVRACLIAPSKGTNHYWPL